MTAGGRIFNLTVGDCGFIGNCWQRKLGPQLLSPSCFFEYILAACYPDFDSNYLTECCVVVDSSLDFVRFDLVFDNIAVALDLAVDNTSADIDSNFEKDAA